MTTITLYGRRSSREVYVPVDPLELRRADSVAHQIVLLCLRLADVGITIKPKRTKP